MHSRKSILWMFLAAALLALPSSAMAQKVEGHVGKLNGHVDAGKQLYFRDCWGCHGFRGDANGDTAPYLNILPRNFVSATFKCRSTPTGTLPTDEDVFNAITRGFYTTYMPSWTALTHQQRADLVVFIKTLSPRWAKEKAGEPVKVPAEPALTTDSIKSGKELLAKLGCWKCHGKKGRGAGPSAATLTDSNDQPIRPYNFAAGSRFKGGAPHPDLYKTLLSGPEGTPMPSFADVIKPEEAWDLVQYLRTLQGTHKSPDVALWETLTEG